MPNWCSNTIAIYEGDKPELEKLYRLITEWTSRNYIKNSFGETWLGNIVLGAGFSIEDYECRGEIADVFLDEEDGSLNIETETAWKPMNAMWHAVIEKFAPHCSFDSFSSEPGSAYYHVEHDSSIETSFGYDYYVDGYLGSSNKCGIGWINKLYHSMTVTDAALRGILVPIFGDLPSDELVGKANHESWRLFQASDLLYCSIFKVYHFVYDRETKQLREETR